MRNLIEETTTQIDGETVTLKRFKPKNKKKSKNVRMTVTSCPNCMSSMILNSDGFWECTGSRLRLWEDEFNKFSGLTKEKQVEYLTTLSSYSRFVELYDKWKYSIEVGVPEEFNCGYTNIIYPPNGTVQVRIPDPLFVKRIEKKLGRPLTEEELYGESELYKYGGKILTQWRKKAIPIRIPWIVLPSEETFYLSTKDE